MRFRFSVFDPIAHDEGRASYRRHTWPSRSIGVDLSDGCPDFGGCIRAAGSLGRLIEETDLPWNVIIPLDHRRHVTDVGVSGIEDDSTLWCPGCRDTASGSRRVDVPLGRDSWSSSLVLRADSDENLVFNVPVRLQLLWH